MPDKDATEMLRADAAGIAAAARLLKRGALVAVPTETVYGLAARADDERAVAAIYTAKGRPSFNPLIVHVRDTDQAEAFGLFSAPARALAREHWPGPLTLVMPRRPEAALANGVTAGLSTIALRVPAHPVMRALLERCDFPLAAPSANPSGATSATEPAHVLAGLDGRIAAIVDGGACPGGLESTIIAIRDDGRIEELRPGPIAVAADRSRRADIEAPGQMTRHYAPGKPIRLNAREVAPDDFFIAFGGGGGDCDLSPAGDLREAAARLYACLHKGGASAKPRIAIAPIPAEGLGIAINDRLSRAAAPACDPDQSGS